MINRQFMNKTVLSEIKPHKGKSTSISCKPFGPCPTWISKENDTRKSFISRTTFRSKNLFYMKLGHLNETINFSQLPKTNKVQEKSSDFPMDQTSTFFPETPLRKQKIVTSTHTKGFNLSSQYEGSKNVRSNSFEISKSNNPRHDRLLKGKAQNKKVEKFRGELLGIKAVVINRQKGRELKDMQVPKKAIIKKTYLFQQQKIDDQCMPRGCSPWGVNPRLDFTTRL